MTKKSLSSNAMRDAADEFETMYKSNQPLVYRFLFWRTKDEMLAQDLTSSVFEKAWRTRTSFSGGSAKAWLYRIARTTLIDYWRKKKELPADENVIDAVISEQARPEEVMERTLDSSALRQAVDRLPADMRDVVELRFVERLSAREVGQRLGISEANVRVIQYRALRKLRGYLS